MQACYSPSVYLYIAKYFTNYQLTHMILEDILIDMPVYQIFSIVHAGLFKNRDIWKGSSTNSYARRDFLVCEKTIAHFWIFEETFHFVTLLLFCFRKRLTENIMRSAKKRVVAFWARCLTYF